MISSATVTGGGGGGGGELQAHLVLVALVDPAVLVEQACAHALILALTASRVS